MKENIVLEDVLGEIIEKDYQNIKKELNKQNNYFSLEELEKIYKIFQKE